MRDKTLLIFILLISLAAHSLPAEDKHDYSRGVPALPLRVESPGARRLFFTEFEDWEDRDSDGYERRRTLSFGAEFAVNPYISLFASQGFLERIKSETISIRRRERLHAGIKLAHAKNYESGKPAFGFSLSIFEKLRGPYMEDESTQYFLIQPSLSMGIRLWKFDIGASLVFQSESNVYFKEDQDDEFRRHYQFEFYALMNLGSNWKLHFETAYREPYNKEIDINVRFWNVYPGVSYLVNGRHDIGASILIPVRTDGYADRGAQMRYCYFF